MSRSRKSNGDLSPLMLQYNQIKDLHPDKLIFYRMGDFYELFGEDAREASQILGITLTSRAHGKEGGRIPLAGVPHHSAEKYLSQLLAAGRKVVICEQTEDPKQARGIVKREVVEVLTPGTPTLDLETGVRPLAAVAAGASRWGVACVDFATGRFVVTEDDEDVVRKWLQVTSPVELLVSDRASHLAEGFGNVHVTERPDAQFRPREAETILTEQFETQTLSGFGVTELQLGIAAAGALVAYLRDTKQAQLDHLTHMRRIDLSQRMFLDPDTVANLELLTARDPAHPETSLFAQVDRTQTPMGVRLLRRRLVAPFNRAVDVEPRLDAATYYVEHAGIAEEIRENMRTLPDFERIAGRIGYGKAHPRELVALAQGIEQVPELASRVRESNVDYLVRICEELPDLSEVSRRVRDTLREEPPVAIHQGGLIRDGVSPELSELRASIGGSRDFLANLQNEERARTGIPSLKVGFNKVFGYYIEVTHVHRDRVPPHYIRKQTLVHAERYITDELKQHEDRVLGAEERIFELEEQLFVALRDSLRVHTRELQALAEGIAAIDVVLGWSELARERRYVRPRMVEDLTLDIVGGRHAVVEQVVAAGRYVPNDTRMDGVQEQIQIITGPNMAGKSTYLRQVGLITLLAQCGSLVPAREATIGMVDRIFTRVGASDQLALGRSTFLVEMEEAANILHHCTDRSLVLLDEIGRGTSTYDGLAIAWAAAEYLHETDGRRPRTLFATHYHELTALADLYPRVHNYQVVVKRHGDRVVFLHEIKPGGCDDSYGIAVARLAGLPPDVIARAKEILHDLETGEFNPEKLRERASPQMGLFTPPPDPIVTELAELDVETLAPLDALNHLAELVARARLRLDRR